MRYRLRTLLILLAVLPPVIAGAWWAAGSGFLAELAGIFAVTLLIVVTICTPVATLAYAAGCLAEAAKKR